MVSNSVHRLAFGAALLVSSLAAVASAESTGLLPSVGAASPQKGRFEAHWEVEGTREELTFGAGPSHSIFRHTGTVTVLRSDGAVGNALSKCIGLSDASSGSSSRCIWIDAQGDEIFTEVQRDAPSPNQTGRGRGRIVGGTGRFVGIEGSFDLSWVLRPSAANAIKGESVSMVGHWQIPASN